MTDEKKDETRFITIPEAVEVMKDLGLVCSVERMRKLARTRELPFFKDGRQLYIRRNELINHYNRVYRERISGNKAA